MKISFKSILVVTLLVVGAYCVGYIVKLNRQYVRYERAYAALQPKASKRSVIDSFGPPSRVERCEKYLSWDGAPLKTESRECAEELWYHSRMSIEQWSVGLDANGLVISKYHHSSP
jgi:hypothetical protein